MTRNAEGAEIHAPFSGVFDFRGDRITFSQIDGERYMLLETKSEPERYRVTRVIGGRYREDFAGVEVRAMTRESPALGLEKILPASYLLFKSEWRYKGYSVMSRERGALKSGPVWQRTCIFCHNTTPYLGTVYDDLYGPQAPVYQGSVSTELPPERAFRFEISNEARLRQELGSELERLGASAPDADTKSALRSASETTRRAFGAADLIEIGIGCEACHGGAREHAEHPVRRPTFAAKSTLFRVRTADGKVPNEALDVNRTCAKCHTVLFSRYPFTWEGRSRDHAPGGSHINSGEARDLLLGGCSQQLHCGACHDPHVEDTKASLVRFEGPAGKRLCTSCHEKYASVTGERAHTHHPPQSAGSACLNCHMPKKNMALNYTLTRYHRIGSPTDRERVEADRPLECALCHADKSTEQITRTMERWWNKRYDRAALARLYGSLDDNTVLATLARGKPHEQAVASVIAANARLDAAIPLMVSALDDEYPLVRLFVKESLERLTDTKLELDVTAPGADVVARARQRLAQ